MHAKQRDRVHASKQSKDDEATWRGRSRGKVPLYAIVARV
jgi:hypothetical protein